MCTSLCCAVKVKGPNQVLHVLDHLLQITCMLMCFKSVEVFLSTVPGIHWCLFPLNNMKMNCQNYQTHFSRDAIRHSEHQVYIHFYQSSIIVVRYVK